MNLINLDDNDKQGFFFLFPVLRNLVQKKKNIDPEKKLLENEMAGLMIHSMIV